MKIVFASDHAGLVLREQLADVADGLGHKVTAVGAQSEDPYDYPDAADEGCAAVLNGDAEFGVLVCGNATGICMRANRNPGIRAATCTSVKMARMARRHNHANVLCLGQRITDFATATDIMEAFLAEPEDHDERHERRVAKIDGGATTASKSSTE